MSIKDYGKPVVIDRRISGAARDTLPLHLSVAIYTLLTAMIAAAYGQFSFATYQDYLSRFSIVYLVSMPLFSAVIAYALKIHRFGPRHQALLEALGPPDLARFVSGIAMLMSFALMLASFTTFKNLMPALQGGFLYDVAQADLDRWLHFGHDPGNLLAGLDSALGPYAGPALRSAMVANYGSLWSLLVFLTPFFIATGRIGTGVRLRYFISIGALWIIAGNVLACLCLSAGPAFYGDVTGDHARFAALMDFVRAGGEGFATPAYFQAYLWDNYIHGEQALGTGISAFPSLHAGIAMMNALFLREFDRRLGLIAFAYTAIILLSSVWLAWHYAIDGYAAIALATLLYLAIRKVFSRTGSRLRAGTPEGAIAAPL